MTEVRWHGRGGQGGWTVARLLGMAVSQFGDQYALAFPSFGPERRGAPVLGFTRVGSQKIRDRSEVRQCDYVVVLDETLIDGTTRNGLRSHGVAVVNSRQREKIESRFPGQRVVVIDATQIALDILGRPITNTAMLGALAAVSNIATLEAINQAIAHEFKPSLVAKNIQVVGQAYDRAKEVLHG